jgi:hypothetical protein
MASLHILNNKESILSEAEKIRQVVYSKIDTQSGWYVASPLRVSKIGADDSCRISSAVNPLDWEVLTEESPEGMAFLLLLEAAINGYHC